MSAFPECDFFCEHTGRLSVFPSSCGTAEQLFAADCTCAEAPIKQNPSYLQSVCTAQQFDALVAAEEARCGSGSVPSAAGSVASIVHRGASLSLGEGLLPSTDGHTTSLFILVPLILVLLALGAAVRVYRRRRALQGV
ncbi:hypothetical protein C2E23DRAFT_851330 [Lenzites betulinus]|nr:hypothetical protein C2E23DRAFT_851330 [Lenzites betulinus]